MMRRLALFPLLYLLFVGINPAQAAPNVVVVATRQDVSGVVVIAPTITDRKGNPQPAIGEPGQYFLVSGGGFAPNQAVHVALVNGSETFPLVPQDLRTSVTQPQPDPLTDATGSFANAAFTIPSAGLVRQPTGELVVAVGNDTARVPVALDLGAVALAGDRLSITFAVAFYAVCLALLALLLRGLPTYPVRKTAKL